MLKKLFLFALFVAGVIGVLYYYDVWVVKQEVDKIIAESEEKITELQGSRVNAIRDARTLLDARLKSGYDLENRPCLAEEIVPGWAVDLVHEPLEDVDRLPQNQCQSYLSGRVPNLILLDEFGHIVDEGIKMGL